MPDRLKDISLFHLTVTIFFMLVAFWPWIKDTWNPHSKTIDEDLKGEDKKWQANELRARDNMRVGRVFVVVFLYVLSTFSLFGTDYPAFVWFIAFFGILGFSGISAYLTKLGFKHHKDDGV